MKLFNFLQPSSANVGEKIRPHFSGFFFNLVSGLTVGLLVGVIVLAFNNPTSNPTAGGGVIGVGSGAPVSSLYINSTGNIGIGTINPGQKLSVVVVIESTYGGFRFPDSTTQRPSATGGWGGGGTLNYVGKFTGTGTIGNSRIFDDGTNGGIGKTPGSYALDINGNVNATAYYGSGANLTGIPGGIPSSKVYDSGWFAVSANTAYTKTHNLGTTKLMVLVYVSQNSDGSGWTAIMNSGYFGAAGDHGGIFTYAISTTNISLRTANSYLYIGYNAAGYSGIFFPGYSRVVILALE